MVRLAVHRRLAENPYSCTPGGRAKKSLTNSAVACIEAPIVRAGSDAAASQLPRCIHRGNWLRMPPLRLTRHLFYKDFLVLKGRV